MAVLHAIGFTQSLLLALYFLNRRKAAPGNAHEALLLLIVGVTIVFGYLYGSHAILEWPHLARGGFTLMSLIGPLFLLAHRARAERGLSFRRDGAWFLVPLGITLYLIPFHLSSRAEKLTYLRADLVAIHTDCVVILFASLANNLGAFATGLALLFRGDRRDASGRPPVGQVIYYVVPVALLFVAAALSTLDPNVLNSGLFSAVGSVVVLARSYVILYKQRQGEDGDAYYPAGNRYSKALLADQFVAEVGARIQRYLSDEQPYLEPDFQLRDVAAHIGLGHVQTSQIINRHFGQTFHQLTRSCRVTRARELLASRPASFTILDIALESGFNSKSAFNAAFRDITGQAPSEFRRSMAASLTP